MGGRIRAALALCGLLWGLGALADQTPVVSSVELHLPSGVDTTGLAELIAVPRGQPLTRRAVRKTIERLFATNRFADVVVRVSSTSQGASVVFELSPKRFIARLSAYGHEVLTESEVLQAAGLHEGDEYYSERIQRAVSGVTDAYERRGYRDAKVTAELGDLASGLEVALLVSEGEPTTIEAVTVGGGPGLPIRRVLEEADLALGQVLDLGAMETGVERLKALYRREGFFRSRVDEPVVETNGTRARVVLPVHAGPRYAIRFRGQRGVRAAQLERALRYDGTEVLDADVQARLANRLVAHYRHQGYWGARVRPSEHLSPDHQRAVLLFEVEEGPRIRVFNVDFAGNAALADGELSDILAERVRQLAPTTDAVELSYDPLAIEGWGQERAVFPAADPSEVLVEDAYHRAAEAMADRYRELGFLSAQVQFIGAEVDDEQRTAVARFVVREGPQTIIATLGFAGVPPEVDGVDVVDIEPGQPLDPGAVEQGRAALARQLLKEGYLFHRVDVTEQLSADGARAELTFRVDSGPRVRVGQVIVQGLHRTEERVVRANVRLKESQVLNPEALYESQRNLALLGIFRQVTVKLIAPETVEKTKDVVVEVKERPLLSGSFGLGYSLVDGPRAIGDAVYPNLGGFGLNLAGRVKANYVGASTQAASPLVDPSSLQGFDGVGLRGNLAAYLPRIYPLAPLEIGARSELVAERVTRPRFQFERYATIWGLEWAARDSLHVGLQYEVEHVRVRKPPGVELELLNAIDAERLRFPVGLFTLQTLRPTATLDFRDDAVNPRSGWALSAETELTREIGATLTNEAGEPVSSFPVRTFKLSATLSTYFPIARRAVLAASLRGGRIYHLHPDSQTIPPKRFDMGGAASMRGFPEDGLLPADRRGDLGAELLACRALSSPLGCTLAAQTLNQGKQLPSPGGELFTLGKLELRFPLVGPVESALFVEAGNLWLDYRRYRPFELRYTAGGGLRVQTPVGPIAFDVGTNLAPDPRVNEPAFVLHFSVGLF